MICSKPSLFFIRLIRDDINERMTSRIHCWLLTSCILILVFKDCQSLFLRHTEYRKCIAAGYLFRSDKYGDHYWAEMVNNCLNVSAQFRYYNELLKNIETGGTFASNFGDIYKNRFAVFKGTPRLGSFENNTMNNLKQTPAGSLYRYNKKTCAQPSKINKYVDAKSGPCSNSESAEQKFTFGTVTKFNSKMTDAHCSSIQSMLIKKANYGYFNNDGTFDYDASIDKKCSSVTTCKVKNLCGGKRLCEQFFDSSLLSSLCTSHTSKELYTEYTCVDTYNFTITKALNIKLSESANKGVIEIKDGSTWRKVYEKYWDKDRQEMLCRHLGFDKTNRNDLATKWLAKDGYALAAGDLVCYDTKLSGTSCCVNLEPSKTSKPMYIPSVTCKVCDNPLDLQNKPTAAFSGSGGQSKYNYARFNRAGWCSSTSATAYLMIDLRKEYRITRVVTMGDKFQTRWSGSYSLKYSHNKTLVNKGRAVQITGNKNGYQASTTKIDIYNARYIKIESTGIKAFCLRIEFCGEVQKPASVTAIATTPSATSVHLSWTIPGTQTSSYITQFIITLDRKLYEISRDMQGNNFEISGLKPNTTYFVGIITEDSSSQRSKIKYTSFDTLEGVPSVSPTNVRFDVWRSKDALRLSWNASLLNGELKGYEVCHSTKENDQNPKCSITTSTAAIVSHTISGLQPSTKYFVTVAAGSSAGYGKKTKEISRITIGEPVNPVANSYSSLRLDLAKQANYIKEVMIIVQIAERNSSSSDRIPTSWLKPYPENLPLRYYVAAYFAVNGRRSKFVIGDGNEYNYRNKTFFNQPLKQNTSYNVFLRFFESQASLYYSTQWSSGVRIMIKPPAPVISKPISIGPKLYQISWSQPSLPEGQSVLKYHVNYSSPGVSGEVSSLMGKVTSITVEYDKQYTFEIQVETEAGRSDISSTSWLTFPAPLERLKKTVDGYIAVLKKPREDQNVMTVALVLLQLKSETSEIPAPENVKVERSAPENNEVDSVAFIAKELNVTDFVGNSIKIILRVRKYNRRRKRNVGLDILQSNKIYRSLQMNTDVFGNLRIKSYWSQEIRIVIDPGGDTGGNTDGNGGNEGEHDDDENSGGSTPVAVGTSLGVVIIVVVVVLVAVLFRRRLALKRKSENELVPNEGFVEMTPIENNTNDRQDDVNIGNRAFNETGSIQESDDYYESIDSANSQDRSCANEENVHEPLKLPRTSSADRDTNEANQYDQTGEEPSDYTSLNKNRETENFYQPLTPPCNSSSDRHTKEADNREQTWEEPEDFYQPVAQRIWTPRGNGPPPPHL